MVRTITLPASASCGFKPPTASHFFYADYDTGTSTYRIVKFFDTGSVPTLTDVAVPSKISNLVEIPSTNLLLASSQTDQKFYLVDASMTFIFLNLAYSLPSTTGYSFGSMVIFQTSIVAVARKESSQSYINMWSFEFDSCKVYAGAICT